MINYLDESILVHPTALTIDYSENVIYWADFYKTGIAMADLNSKKAKVCGYRPMLNDSDYWAKTSLS